MNDIANTGATNVDKRIQIMLIHGGFHGVWVWGKVVDRLAALGWSAQTVALPSVAAKDQPRYGMHDDAVAVRRRLEVIEDPVVVVAHSYGGIVATQAAVGLKNVAHIIYLAAFQLDVGDSLLGVVGGPAPWWIVEDDMLSAGRPFETFFPMCLLMTPGGRLSVYCLRVIPLLQNSLRRRRGVRSSPPM
ncbi:alpha/beta hydrolase [Mycobacterium montefiorense]|nr:alpha/beta hydrolase [Mycobacterium montefiorense]MCV7428269.1 alpha/beta hydrolase [Mycobacterium montefiorense]